MTDDRSSKASKNSEARALQPGARRPDHPVKVSDSIESSVPKSAERRPLRRRPLLTFCDIDQIADDVSRALERSPLTENEKGELLHSINETLDDYAINDRLEKMPTFNQFKKSFFEVQIQLRHLKRILPSPRGNDRDRQLFEAICRHGEDYAAKHGPHPGLDPIELPAIPLPYAFEHLGVERLEPENRYRSAGRLRELIGAVNEVCAWVDRYNEGLIPKMGWRRWEAHRKRSTSEFVRDKGKGEAHRKAHVQLIGHTLPKTYSEYFGDVPRSGSSSGKNRCGRIYRPWVVFVCAVYEEAFRRRLSPATVEKYWKQMRKALA
jgi:hypothetical protein